LSDEEAILSLAACVKEHRNPYRGKGGPQPYVGGQLGRLLFNGPWDFPFAMFLSFLGVAIVFRFRHCFGHRLCLLLVNSFAC
jgi:hypothetical protein